MRYRYQQTTVVEALRKTLRFVSRACDTTASILVARITGSDGRVMPGWVEIPRPLGHKTGRFRFIPVASDEILASIPRCPSGCARRI